MKVVSPQVMAQLDRRAVEEYEIPTATLMDRAGYAVAMKALQVLRNYDLPRNVLVFAGKGNNGGDGFVAARYLDDFDIPVRVVVVGDPLQGGSAVVDNYQQLIQRKLSIFHVEDVSSVDCLIDREMLSTGVVIDALLGTGFRAPVEGVVLDLIRLINSRSWKVVAIDIPSGLDAMSGQHSPEAVCANFTVTMALPKSGFLRGQAVEYIGQVEVADIGMPSDLIFQADSEADLLVEQDVRGLVPARKRRSHKGTYGHLGVIAGSPGMCGAAVLAVRAACRVGTGMVTAVVPKAMLPAVDCAVLESLTLGVPETDIGSMASDAFEVIGQAQKGWNALVVGCGLSLSAETTEFVRSLVLSIDKPVVLDADGLNAFAGKDKELKAHKGPLILTPHPRELARLRGVAVDQIQQDRVKAACDCARLYECTVVLKGAMTVIADSSGQWTMNSTGNPGMASGGMGDVLAGMIGGFVTQGLLPFDAARLGVFLHGRAGDIAALQGNEPGIIASDLISCMGQAMRTVVRY